MYRLSLDLIIMSLIDKKRFKLNLLRVCVYLRGSDVCITMMTSRGHRWGYFHTLYLIKTLKKYMYPHATAYPTLLLVYSNILTLDIVH